MDVHALGRSAVVGPGQPAPPEWAGLERVPVTGVDAAVADQLQAAWLDRRPVVVELAPGAGLSDPGSAPAEEVRDRQPWEWDPGLELIAEKLHHAIWANAVDARSGSPRWRWAEAAAGLGARVASGPDGDVILPDGRRAVCDGGPLDAGLAGRAGMPVVHRVGLEHGSLAPLGDPSHQVPSHHLTGLAPDQLAAVTEPLAAARIIAPAGSGKTRVLTERARALVNQWGLPAASLALVAYNVRAAQQMRDRLTDVPGLRIRTLNALGLRLCGRATTIEEVEVRRILSGLVAFPQRAETDPAAPWIEALSRVRLGLADPIEVEEELPDVSDLARVAREYRSELARRDAADFDDQVVGAIERLLADSRLRARSQRFARVLLVDEFQDLTPAHMLLIRLLAGPAGSVFAVGDDDQTIYGYAGATPAWLVDFGRWFPGSATHSLEVNYRCPPKVVEAATNLLSRNRSRVPKQTRPARADRAGADREGGLEVVLPEKQQPATSTADAVQDLVDQGAAPGDIAVLARVNASLVPVHVVLGHRGIPVNGASDRRFLQRGGVRAALAWLEVATAPGARLPGPALREAARRPKRGMSNSLLDLIARCRSADALDNLAGWLENKGNSREADKVEQFARDVAVARRAADRGSTAEILGVVRRQIGGAGLDASASALDQWSHGAIAAHLDDLEALAELAELQPDPDAFPAWLAERLDVPGDPAGVTLASIHAVKGREWPYVVVHHATAGLMPHRLAADVEEERRVFHVGLTRASVRATIVAGSPPSPFVAELAEAGRPPEPLVRVSPPVTGPARPPGPTGQNGKVELLAAPVGMAFSLRGHDYQVVEIRADGAGCRIEGGAATTSVPFGTVVTAQGRSVVLAHPASARAWDALRAWRTGKARELGKPPFVVFDDRTLRMVAARLPTTEAGLLAISGIGPVKLDAYGAELMAITEECRAAPPG